MYVHVLISAECVALSPVVPFTNKHVTVSTVLGNYGELHNVTVSTVLGNYGELHNVTGEMPSASSPNELHKFTAGFT